MKLCSLSKLLSKMLLKPILPAILQFVISAFIHGILATNNKKSVLCLKLCPERCSGPSKLRYLHYSYRMMVIKGALSGLGQFVATESEEKCFFVPPKSSFRSQDIYLFF